MHWVFSGSTIFVGLSYIDLVYFHPTLVWPSMTMYGPIWPWVAQYDTVWHNMTLCGTKCPCATQNNMVWFNNNITQCGLIWPVMIHLSQPNVPKYDLIRPNMTRCHTVQVTMDQQIPTWSNRSNMIQHSLLWPYHLKLLSLITRFLRSSMYFRLEGDTVV